MSFDAFDINHRQVYLIFFNSNTIPALHFKSWYHNGEEQKAELVFFLCFSPVKIMPSK